MIYNLDVTWRIFYIFDGIRGFYKAKLGETLFVKNQLGPGKKWFVFEVSN